MFTRPLLIGNIFQQLYNMADTLIVGRTIGADALAAVGCTGSIMFFIIGFAMGMTSGLSIVVAQRFGAGDEAGVRRSFGHRNYYCRRRHGCSYGFQCFTGPPRSGPDADSG